MPIINIKTSSVTQNIRPLVVFGYSSIRTPNLFCECPKHLLECPRCVQTENVGKKLDNLDFSVGNVSGECPCPIIVWHRHVIFDKVSSLHSITFYFVLLHVLTLLKPSLRSYSLERFLLFIGHSQDQHGASLEWSNRIPDPRSHGHGHGHDMIQTRHWHFDK